MPATGVNGTNSPPRTQKNEYEKKKSSLQRAQSNLTRKRPTLVVIGINQTEEPKIRKIKRQTLKR